MYIPLFRVVFLISFSTVLFGQQGRYDDIWLFGRFSHTDSIFNGGSKLNFNSSPPEVTQFDIPTNLDLFQMSVISDPSGNLVAYTNGCRILDSTHQTMAGGDGINLGYYFERNCLSEYEYYPLQQSLMFIPLPSSDSLYYLFHLRLVGYILSDLLYTVVNSRGNGGRGQVESKNNLLLRDLPADQLTAARHGNGRDWWIMAPQDGFSRRYFTFLLTPQGIQGPYEQEVGNYRRHGPGAQAVFSPNGKKFIIGHTAFDITVFDFDRCTGLLSNDQYITLPPPQVSGRGVAVSPSSRYLYASNLVDLYQYDLYAANINRSRVHIDTYDGGMAPLWATFFQQKLAPDGKIYMSANNGVNILHVIHEPDSAGTACHFEQRGLQLPHTHGFCVPNFPWFRLYDSPGSPCDTLGIDLTPEEPPIPTDLERVSVRVYPNPAAGETQVVLSGTLDVPLECRLLNATGVEVLRETLSPGSVVYPIDLARLPAGVYIWVVSGGRKFRVQGKLVLVR